MSVLSSLAKLPLGIFIGASLLPAARATENKVRSTDPPVHLRRRLAGLAQDVHKIGHHDPSPGTNPRSRSKSPIRHNTEKDANKSAGPPGRRIKTPANTPTRQGKQHFSPKPRTVRSHSVASRAARDWVTRVYHQLPETVQINSIRLEDSSDNKFLFNPFEPKFEFLTKTSAKSQVGVQNGVRTYIYKCDPTYEDELRSGKDFSIVTKLEIQRHMVAANSPHQRAWICELTYIVVLNGRRQEVILHRQSKNLNGIFKEAEWSSRIRSGVGKLRECDKPTVDLRPCVQSSTGSNLPEPMKMRKSKQDPQEINVKSSPRLCVNIMRFAKGTAHTTEPLTKAERKIVRAAVFNRTSKARNKVVYVYRAKDSKISVRSMDLTFTLTSGGRWTAKLSFVVRRGKQLKTHSCILEEPQTSRTLNSPLNWRMTSNTRNYHDLEAKIQITLPSSDAL